MDSSDANYDWFDVVCTEGIITEYPISFICQKPYIDVKTTTPFIASTTEITISTTHIKSTTKPTTSTEIFSTTPDTGR